MVDRLLRGDPQAHVVVDHDRTGPSLSLAEHPRLSTRLSDRGRGWGSYALVSATHDALRAIQHDLDPDWVVLISGQDYPVVAPAEVRRQLQESSVDAHLRVVCRITDASARGELRFWHARYFFAWRSLPRIPVALPVRWLQRRINLEYRFSRAQSRLFVWTLPRGSGTRIGLRRSSTPFSELYPCWGATQWFAASRRALVILDHEFQSRPELVALYRHSVIPDESMLQTMLLNAPELSIGQPNLTFGRHGGADQAHADVLDLADLDEITASGLAFARKMDPLHSAALMDALDERIGLGVKLETAVDDPQG